MMFSLSAIAARRAAPVARRSLSTQTLTQVHDLESLLQSRHWAYTKENVEELRQVMNEYKTNKTIRSPDSALEQSVASRMKEIQDSVAKGADRDAVTSEIFGLKRMVKSQLYGQV